MIRAQPSNRGWCYPSGSSIVRGYDTSPLFREDCLLRIQHLQMEVDASMKRIKQGEKELAAIEERLRRTKKEMGEID